MRSPAVTYNMTAQWWRKSMSYRVFSTECNNYNKSQVDTNKILIYHVVPFKSSQYILVRSWELCSYNWMSVTLPISLSGSWIIYFCMFFDAFWGKRKTARVNLLFLNRGLTFIMRFFMSHLKPWCVSVKKKKSSDMSLSSSRQEWITTWKQLQVGN